MKGVGWEAEGCLNITQAKKAGELLSDVSKALLVCLIVLNLFASNQFPLWSQTKYRQKADSIGFTQVADDLATQHAKKSQELQSDVSLSTLILRTSPGVSLLIRPTVISSWRTKQTSSRRSTSTP